MSCTLCYTRKFSSCGPCVFHDHTILVAHNPPIINKCPRVSILLCHFPMKLPICRSSCYKLIKCMTLHIMQLNFIPFLILYSQGHLVFLVRYYILPLCWALCHHQTSLVHINFLSGSLMKMLKNQSQTFKDFHWWQFFFQTNYCFFSFADSELIFLLGVGR